MKEPITHRDKILSSFWSPPRKTYLRQTIGDVINRTKLPEDIVRHELRALTFEGVVQGQSFNSQEYDYFLKRPEAQDSASALPESLSAPLAGKNEGGKA